MAATLASTFLPAVVVLALSSGCRESGRREAATRPATLSGASPSPARGAAGAVARCPLKAMSLNLSAPDGGSQPLLSLSENGEVTWLGRPKPLARLDANGCLFGDDGVWVEVLPDASLWTLREVYQSRGNRWSSGPGRAFQIESDGTVVSLSDDQVQPSPEGTLRFSGFSEPGRCAASTLLVVFLGMAPSMTVSDGHPVVLPPPKNSLCPRH